MTPTELLVRLQEVGCRVTAEGGTLRVRGLLDDDLRYEIRKHKAELLEILRSPGESAGASPCTRAALAGGELEVWNARTLEPFGRGVEPENRGKTGAKQRQVIEGIENKAEINAEKRIENGAIESTIEQVRTERKEGGPAPDRPNDRVEFCGLSPVLIVNGVNPLDYRRDPKTGKWIVDPGWWRSISRRGVLHDNSEADKGNKRNTLRGELNNLNG